MRNLIFPIGIAAFFSSNAIASDMVEPQDLGVVESPVVGSKEIDLHDVPGHILHTAKVAFKEFDGNAFLTGAKLDMDEILAIYEVQGETRDGEKLEADIKPNGELIELELEIGGDEVPDDVTAAKDSLFPDFQPAEESPAIEKSIRPSEGGLPEIWYEFSGTGFDVEVRSDGKALLAEPE